MCLLNRSAFSIFGQMYKFLEAHRGSKSCQLTSVVRRELVAMSNVSGLLWADLGKDWLPVLLMTDASPTGGALVTAEATADQLRGEAQWSSAGGWQVVTDAPESDEVEEVLQGSAKGGWGQIPRSLKVKLFRFLHLFSGPPRTGDLRWHLEAWSVVSGVLVVVDCVDLLASPPTDV